MACFTLTVKVKVNVKFCKKVEVLRISVSVSSKSLSGRWLFLPLRKYISRRNCRTQLKFSGLVVLSKFCVLSREFELYSAPVHLVEVETYAGIFVSGSEL